MFVPFSSELMYEISVVSFRPATVPASFTTTIWVCEWCARSNELHNRWDKSGKEHDDQEDNARDNKTALGDAVFVLASDDQANIAQGMLGSSTA